jgi:hypothetical protein
MDRFNRVTSAVFLPCIVVMCGCQNLTPHDRPSLIDPQLYKAEPAAKAAVQQAAGYAVSITWE